MEELVTLHLFAEDYPTALFWKLVRWCRDRGAEEWNVTVIETRKGKKAEISIANDFDSRTAPFRLANARRRHLTGRRADGTDFIRPLELWRLTSKSLAVLEEFFPNGVFSYEASAEGWLEDLILYRHIDRHSELMLGVVSHEGEGVLRVTNQEQRQLERDGFPFRLRGTYVGY